MIGLTQHKPLTPDTALKHLRALESRDNAKVLAALFLGIPLSFLGPALVAGIYWMLAFVKAYDNAPPFAPVFSIACLVVLPIMYFSAWRRKTSYAEEFMEDGVDPYVGARVFTTLLVFDILLFAPNMVIYALKRMADRKRLAGVNLSRVAAAFVTLANSEESISPDRLLRPGESPDALCEIVPWLVHHDLIGMSKEGSRVWLLSDARRRLPQK